MVYIVNKKMGYNNTVVQILKQVDDLKVQVLTRSDLLNDSLSWTEQQKLQSIYQQALTLDLEYALDKKVEVDLWNIGFKNHINILQELVRDKKNSQRADCQALLTWCLESASGFYISLLQEFCNRYDIDLPFRRQGRVYGQTKELIGNDYSNSPQSTSCLYICQYCLVHLGDIARYRNQRKQAENFYKQAIQVSPHSGHPYNQLALLEASLGDRLSTVFYYVRGIAVKNPFPAAITNLSSTLSVIIDKERPKDKLQSRLTVNEFIDLFICTHGYIYTLTELFQAQSIVKNLGTIMTALVATQSFTEDKLIKMTVINLYALEHISNGRNNEELTPDEKKARLLILDLLASFLSAFLVPVYTLQMDKNLLDYYALPAVKIIFYWIQNSPSVLTESVFMKRLQIWPSLCKLLNNIEVFLKDFCYEEYSNVPLKEDRNLKGFLPLSNYLKQFDFERIEDDLNILQLIRIKRILSFGLWLTDFEVNGTKLITKIESENSMRFEPGCIQPDPTIELLEEIKSFSIEQQQSQNSGKTEKKAGILKPQGSLEKNREEREQLTNLENNVSDVILAAQVNNTKQETAKMKRAKQNAALQSIYKKMEENKQVKFSVEEKKLVKFEQKPIPTSRSPTVSINTQFGSSVRPTPSFNQNHSTAFPPVSSHQQDYLTSLRNMANNYGMGNNYPMQNMYGGGMRSGMPSPAWGSGQAPPKTSYTPMNMGAATYNHLQSSGFDGNATANWWNGPGNNVMPPNAPGFNNNFSTPPPFGGPMMPGPKLGSNNQASGDSFNAPWNYNRNAMGAFEQSGNLTMRQQMLKEANNMTNNLANSFKVPRSDMEKISFCRCHE